MFAAKRRSATITLRSVPFVVSGTVRYVIAGVLVVLAARGAAADTPAPLRRWLTEDRGGVIQFEPCGTFLCGRIVGIAEFAPDGSPPRDVNGHPECGLAIMTDLAEAEPGVWAGHVTNPETGSVWDVRVRMNPDGRLNVRGYLGIRLLGETQLWTPFDGTVAADCHFSLAPAERR